MLNNESNPRVSVIIRTKDRQEFLPRAIESVLSQTYSNIELVVINDGGNDISSTISHFKSQFETSTRSIQHIVNKRTQGRTLAANIGLKSATGKYVAFLDDDDYYLSTHIEYHVKALEKNYAQFSISKAIESIETCHNGKFQEQEKRFHFPSKINRLSLFFFENYFPFNTLVFRKEVVDKIGKFDANIEVLEDWDFIIRLFLNFKPELIDKVTTVFTTRLGNSNVRMSFEHKKTWKEAFEYVQNKYKSNYKESEIAIPITEVSGFLSTHAKEWYKLVKENDELRNSFAYKLYYSKPYRLLKKIGKLVGKNRG